MVKDLPDYTKGITILLQAEIISQVRNIPWWLRFQPKRILFLDDFEGVLKWVQQYGTVAKGSGLDTFEGTYNLDLTTPATGAGEVVSTYITLGGVLPSKFAVHLWWHCLHTDGALLRNFQVKLYLYDGQYVHQALIQYIKNETTPQNKWRYMNESSYAVDIPDGAEVIDTTTRQHHLLYLTVDMTADINKYQRLVTSALDLDLSALGYPRGVSTDPP